MSSHQDAMTAQRERIEELEEEVRQLRELLAPALPLPARFGFTKAQRKILGALMKHSPMTVRREAIMRGIYFDLDEAPDNTRIMDIWISRIRKALAPLGVEIGTDWGVGYFIDAKSAAALRDLFEEGGR